MVVLGGCPKITREIESLLLSKLVINVLKYILSIRIPLCYAVGLTFWFQVQLNDDGIQGVVTNSAKCSGGKHIGL